MQFLCVCQLMRSSYYYWTMMVYERRVFLETFNVELIGTVFCKCVSFINYWIRLLGYCILYNCIDWFITLFTYYLFLSLLRYFIISSLFMLPFASRWRNVFRYFYEVKYRFWFIFILCEVKLTAIACSSERITRERIIIALLTEILWLVKLGIYRYIFYPKHTFISVKMFSN